MIFFVIYRFFKDFFTLQVKFIILCSPLLFFSNASSEKLIEREHREKVARFSSAAAKGEKQEVRANMFIRGVSRQ